MAQRINRRLSRIENFFSMLLTKGKISDNIFVCQEIAGEPLFATQFILAPYIIKSYGANLIEDNYEYSGVN